MGSYFSLPTSQPELEGESSSASVSLPGCHHPTPDDVFAVRDCLLHFLPLEVVDMILDTATYWPRITASRRTILVASASRGQANNADWCYLVTPPIPQRERQEGEDTEIRTKIKRVCFCFSSCDQGWGGDPALSGTYHASWTWFEAAILRPSARGPPPGWLKLVPHRPVDLHKEGISTEVDLRTFSVQELESLVDGKQRWHIQRNVHVSSQVREHEVVWTDDVDGGDFDDEDVERGCGTGRGFVHLLRAGDRIAVMARALYPGWINEVHGVEVEIYYSV